MHMLRKEIRMRTLARNERKSQVSQGGPKVAIALGKTLLVLCKTLRLLHYIRKRRYC